MRNITYIITVEEATEAEEEALRKALIRLLTEVRRARVQIQMSWETTQEVS